MPSINEITQTIERIAAEIDNDEESIEEEASF